LFFEGLNIVVGKVVVALSRRKTDRQTDNPKRCSVALSFAKI